MASAMINDGSMSPQSAVNQREERSGTLCYVDGKREPVRIAPVITHV